MKGTPMSTITPQVWHKNDSAYEKCDEQDVMALSEILVCTSKFIYKY